MVRIDLTGRTSIVTGGSRGIGKAAALLFARAGARVAIGYRSNREAAESVLEELRRKGRHVIAVRGDLSRLEHVEELFRKARETFGRIDIVVANAGIWKGARIEEMSQEEWRETLEINLTSAVYTCRYAAREMESGGGGSIVMVSSTAGQRGEAFHSHYAASKGGMISLTKSLATELGPRGIRVNAVAPGWVITDMSHEALQDPATKESVISDIPLGRIASAEDVAGPILFLASDLARHITGEILNVNGGAVLCG